jgi:4-hydroxythreonine-4-phosphate dehydrogenase
MTRSIAITMGDPSGIGAEVIVRALAEAPEALRRRARVFGDQRVLERAAQVCGLPGLPEGMRVEPVTRLAELDSIFGRPTAPGGAAQVSYLEAAVGAARGGEVVALCTAPISKTVVRWAGFNFAGHTEFLADRLGAAEVAMMFAGPQLRVVLVSIHVPLAEVAAHVTIVDVARATFLAGEAMARRFKMARPRVGVLGLNPHAGEAGLFGREEQTIIAPGIEAARVRLRAAGIDAQVIGPLVPDAAFREALPGPEPRHDVLVCMYHDQGLIPVKLIDFEDSVNVTLGLPTPRTSPDHGTAYDIAGTGRARHRSFAAAYRLAAELAPAS